VDAGGVHQGEGHPFEHQLAFQQVPGGAGQIGHDRPVLAAEAVEQGRFAHVGATHNRHPQTLAQALALLRLPHQILQLGPHTLQALNHGLGLQGG
jgi:hypothetical protein